MTVRSSSLDAFYELIETEEMSKQENIICNVFVSYNVPMSLREIQSRCQLDINAISGRVNGLKKRNILKEYEKRRCSITGRLIIPVGF